MGQPRHADGNRRDETHAAQCADAALADVRERLEAYELALEMGGVGAWEWDLRSGQFRWSRQLETITGLRAGDFDGRYESFLALVHPDDVGGYRKSVRAALDGRQELDTQFRLLRADDGAERWMHTTAVVVRDDEGQARRMVGNQTDITERRQADVRLRETTGLLEYVLDTSPIVLFAGSVRDGEFVPEYVSRSSERVQGWSAEAFLSGAVRWENLMHPDDAQRVLAANRRALVEGHSEWETRLRMPGGGYGHYRTVLRVTRDDAGKASYVGLTIDVTESRRIERQLQQAQKLEAVGQLAGGVAHDFNNLLLAITGYTEAARMSSAPGGEADRALAEVQRAAQQGSALVRQLLAFSRREELPQVSVDVVEAIRGMRSLIETTIGGRVRLTLALHPDCACVRLGAGQLEQLVLNLAVNARDAMPEGGELTISAAPVQLGAPVGGETPLTPGSYVRVAAIDTGSGMSPEVRAHAFEPFFTTKPTGHGTGLGLATVYGTVSKAGGQVSVTSAPGAGTTVELHLPRHTPQADAADPSPGRGRVEDGAPPPREPGGGRASLLLVEDQPQVRALLTTSLERMGFEVLTATSGADALSLVDREEPDLDLVITDVVMPDLNGLQVADHLRARYPGLGVLFMSGYADTSADRASSGDQGFIQKPFSLSELTSEVSRILAR